MTKIDIFSGFLGAGKTTLIKKTGDHKPLAITRYFHCFRV